MDWLKAMNWVTIMEQMMYEVQDDMEKSTTELFNELQQADDVLEFARENIEELECISLTEQLDILQQKYGKQKSEIIKDSGLDTTYAYQIFDGKRKPKRDKLLQLAFGFPLSVEDTNRLFRAGGVNDLYVRNRRDAICMYCLQQKMTVDACDTLLFQAGEETLTE